MADSAPRLLSDDEIATQLQTLPNWKPTTAEGDSAITTTYERDDFMAAIKLVEQLADVAEEMNHHPDIDIRWNKVTLVLSPHSEGGLTQLDVEAAPRLDEAAS